jgi:hypothetical protein
MTPALRSLAATSLTATDPPAARGAGSRRLAPLHDSASPANLAAAFAAEVDACAAEQGGAQLPGAVAETRASGPQPPAEAAPADAEAGADAGLAGAEGAAGSKDAVEPLSFAEAAAAADAGSDARVSPREGCTPAAGTGAPGSLPAMLEEAQLAAEAPACGGREEGPLRAADIDRLQPACSGREEGPLRAPEAEASTCSAPAPEAVPPESVYGAPAAEPRPGAPAADTDRLAPAAKPRPAPGEGLRQPAAAEPVAGAGAPAADVDRLTRGAGGLPGEGIASRSLPRWASLLLGPAADADGGPTQPAPPPEPGLAGELEEADAVARVCLAPAASDDSCRAESSQTDGQTQAVCVEAASGAPADGDGGRVQPPEAEAALAAEREGGPAEDHERPVGDDDLLGALQPLPPPLQAVPAVVLGSGPAVGGGADGAQRSQPPSEVASAAEVCGGGGRRGAAEDVRRSQLPPDVEPGAAELCSDAGEQSVARGPRLAPAPESPPAVELGDAADGGFASPVMDEDARGSRFSLPEPPPAAGSSASASKHPLPPPPPDDELGRPNPALPAAFDAGEGPLLRV